jgi:hypothetical protein
VNSGRGVDVIDFNIEKITVTVELDADVHEYLETLARHSGGFADNETVASVLVHLANCAAGGMRRPVAWERGWIEQAFGDDWVRALEMRPRK